MIARGLAPPPELPPGITLQSRSRSSKVRCSCCIHMPDTTFCTEPCRVSEHALAWSTV